MNESECWMMRIVMMVASEVGYIPLRIMSTPVLLSSTPPSNRLA